MESGLQQRNELTAAGQVQQPHVALLFVRQPGGSGVHENYEAPIGGPVGRHLEIGGRHRFFDIVLAQAAQMDADRRRVGYVRERQRRRIRRPDWGIPKAWLRGQSPPRVRFDIEDPEVLLASFDIVNRRRQPLPIRRQACGLHVYICRTDRGKLVSRPVHPHELRSADITLVGDGAVIRNGEIRCAGFSEGVDPARNRHRFTSYP